MSSYIDRHAELYDIFYADKPYGEEAAFVAGCLAAGGVADGGTILELACGTGRHAFELEKRGYQVVATDYSPDMLARAARSKVERGSAVRFLQQDMRHLDLPGEVFDAAVSLFDSIGYVETNAAILETLAGIHRHLRAGGLLVLEFWHAAAMLRAYDPVRVRRFRTLSSDVVRISETRLDPARQTAEVAYTIFETDDQGATRTIRESQTNRYFLMQEMAGWLDRAGFAPLRWCAGFDDVHPIDADTWHIVVVARRRP
jgi:SAM-dependent methyltransferase